MDLEQAMITALFTVAGALGASWLIVLNAKKSIKNAATHAFGELTRQVTEHERRLDDNDKDQERQWDRIIGAELRLENLRGRHKLNGGHE